MSGSTAFGIDQRQLHRCVAAAVDEEEEGGRRLRGASADVVRCQGEKSRHVGRAAHDAVESSLPGVPRPQAADRPEGSRDRGPRRRSVRASPRAAARSARVPASAAPARSPRSPGSPHAPRRRAKPIPPCAPIAAPRRRDRQERARSRPPPRAWVAGAGYSGRCVRRRRARGLDGSGSFEAAQRAQLIRAGVARREMPHDRFCAAPDQAGPDSPRRAATAPRPDGLPRVPQRQISGASPCARGAPSLASSRGTTASGRGTPRTRGPSDPAGTPRGRSRFRPDNSRPALRNRSLVRSSRSPAPNRLTHPSRLPLRVNRRAVGAGRIGRRAGIS